MKIRGTKDGDVIMDDEAQKLVKSVANKNSRRVAMTCGGGFKDIFVSAGEHKFVSFQIEDGNEWMFTRAMFGDNRYRLGKFTADCIEDAMVITLKMALDYVPKKR